MEPQNIIPNAAAQGPMMDPTYYIVMNAFDCSMIAILALLGYKFCQSSYRYYQTNQRINEEYQYLLKNPIPQSADQALSQTDKNGGLQFKLIKGRAVGGLSLLKTKAEGKPLYAILKTMDKQQNKEDIPIIFKFNQYIRKSWFTQEIITQDIESQNITLISKPPTSKSTIFHPYEQVSLKIYPRQNIILEGFRNHLKEGKDSARQDIFYRTINTLFSSAQAYAFYNTLSKIIYEGDKISVFGLIEYNINSDQWEMSKPIGFMKGRTVDLLRNTLWWKKLSKMFKSVLVGALGGLSIFCVGYFIYRLQGRILLRMRQKQMQVLQAEDRALQIQEAPPFVRHFKGKDISIDSYSCSQCNKDVREIIFVPCKHFYLCYNCYSKKSNKYKCDKCSSSITELVKVYVQNDVF